MYQQVNLEDKVILIIETLLSSAERNTIVNRQDKFTFQKHPEEGGEMKISNNDLADTKDREHRLKIICPDQILK